MIHPDDQRIIAVAGHDKSPAIGWFIEVRRRGGRLVEEYDGFTEGGEPSTLKGVLQVFVRHGFITQPDLEYALTQLYFGFTAAEIDGDGAGLDGARRAAELVVALKQGSAD